MGSNRAAAAPKDPDPVPAPKPKKDRKTRGGFIGSPDVERRGSVLDNTQSRRSKFLGT